MATHQMTLITVMKLADVGIARVARILERPDRTIYSWLAAEGATRRNIPYCEIERLCFIIDPTGERPDLIGWVVVAARARWEGSFKKDPVPNRAKWRE